MYGKKVDGVLRSTFLVKDGKVARVFPNVKVDGHADAVVEAVAALSKGANRPAKAAKAPPTTTTRGAKKTAAKKAGLGVAPKAMKTTKSPTRKKPARRT